MRVSQLRQLIREQVRRVLNENLKSKNDGGVRLVVALHSNINAIDELIKFDKKDVNDVMSTFSNPLLNSIKGILKHRYIAVPGQEEKLNEFISEMKKFQKIVEFLIKKPSIAGVKKMNNAWNVIWNHRSGAIIALNGKYEDTIIK